MLKRETHLQFLEQAQRHVALGEKHIADQERLVAELRRTGQDIGQSLELLNLFRDTQIQHIAHRDLLLMELDSNPDIL